MSMKRCIVCGWWFEPHARNQKTCDDECRRESLRRSWRESKRRKHLQDRSKDPRKTVALKCDPSKLPQPPRPATKECRKLGPPTPEAYERLIDNQWAPHGWGRGMV